MRRNASLTNVVITSAARTAIGSYGKSLAGVAPTDLGATAAKAAIERAGITPEQIEHVVFGNVIHTETADAYMARVVGMKAGIPKETPAFTVNRLCGTGVQALVRACQAIQTGEADVTLAGGAESMSRAPMWLTQGRWGSKMGPAPVIDPVQGALTDPFHDIKMGVTAENLAERMGDLARGAGRVRGRVAPARVAAPQSEGRFDDEVVPVSIKVKREVVDFVKDEHIRHGRRRGRHGQAADDLQEGRRHGHGGQRVGHERRGRRARADERREGRRARRAGARARARLRVVRRGPEIMGIGPVPAVRKVLDRAGVSLDDIGVIELNEAFAAQALAVIKDLDLDPARVNPNGGAIALGHPIAATGAAITAKCLSEMDRGEHRYGLVTLCIGGGQGIALLLGRE